MLSIAYQHTQKHYTIIHRVHVHVQYEQTRRQHLHKPLLHSSCFHKLDEYTTSSSDHDKICSRCECVAIARGLQIPNRGQLTRRAGYSSTWMNYSALSAQYRGHPLLSAPAPCVRSGGPQLAADVLLPHSDVMLHVCGLFVADPATWRQRADAGGR